MENSKITFDSLSNEEKGKQLAYYFLDQKNTEERIRDNAFGLLLALIKIKGIMLLPEEERPVGWVRDFLQGYGGEAIEKALEG